MSQESDYFFADLDFHLRMGCEPKVALEKTIEEYAFVFHDVQMIENKNYDWPNLLKGL